MQDGEVDHAQCGACMLVVVNLKIDVLVDMLGGSLNGSLLGHCMSLLDNLLMLLIVELFGCSNFSSSHCFWDLGCAMQWWYKLGSWWQSYSGLSLSAEWESQWATVCVANG